MVSIDSITDEEYVKYKDIFELAYGLFGWNREDSYKVIQDGNCFIMFSYFPVFMLFNYNEYKRLEYKTFMVDNDYKIVSFTMNDYQVNLGDNLIYLIDEVGNHQSLQFIKNSDEPNFEVSANGIITYMQYNSKNDIRLVLKYDQSMYSDNGVIYSNYLKRPFYVSVENKPKLRDKGLFFLGKKDVYYKLDFDVYNNKWQYDLATIQEFGIDAVIASDTITLHGGQTEFSRYYKQLFSIGDYISITGFPILKQYKEMDIDYIIDKLNFNKDIPMVIATIYNNKEMIVEEFEEIISSYLELKSLRKEKK